MGHVRRVVMAALAAALLPAAPATAAETTLLPGAPPAVVVRTIGAGTPQVAAKIDATSAVFRPDPALAADMMAANPDIALIVTDVVMPGLTGPELVAQLHDAHPDVGVLFVTGYAGEVEDKAFGGHAVLRKPFTMGRLTHAVEAALAQARVSAAAE